MMLTRMAMSQIQAATHRTVLLTLTLSWQPVIASHVWVLRKWPSIQPAKTSRRKYGPFAVVPRVASDQRPS